MTRRPPLLVKVQAHDGTPLGEGIYREDVKCSRSGKWIPLPLIEMKNGSSLYGDQVRWEPIHELDVIELALWDRRMVRLNTFLEEQSCPNCEKMRAAIKKVRPYFNGEPGGNFNEDLKALFSLVTE